MFTGGSGDCAATCALAGVALRISEAAAAATVMKAPTRYRRVGMDMMFSSGFCGSVARSTEVVGKARDTGSETYLPIDSFRP
jgi:hypothetical protein